jgi:hypothetical protein
MTEMLIPEVTASIGEFGYDMRQDINGGRLYVAVQTTGGKRSWMGAITESDVKPFGWWCSMVISNKRPFCERDGQHCEQHRTQLKDFGTTSEPCHMQPTAHCFIRRFHGDRMSICFRTTQAAN